jgi:hypothetical protein
VELNERTTVQKRGTEKEVRAVLAQRAETWGAEGMSMRRSVSHL